VKVSAWSVRATVVSTPNVVVPVRPSPAVMSLLISYFPSTVLKEIFVPSSRCTSSDCGSVLVSNSKLRRALNVVPSLPLPPLPLPSSDPNAVTSSSALRLDRTRSPPSSVRSRSVHAGFPRIFAHRTLSGGVWLPPLSLPPTSSLSALVFDSSEEIRRRSSSIGSGPSGADVGGTRVILHLHVYFLLVSAPPLIVTLSPNTPSPAQWAKRPFV